MRPVFVYDQDSWAEFVSHPVYKVGIYVVILHAGFTRPHLNMKLAVHGLNKSANGLQGPIPGASQRSRDLGRMVADSLGKVLFLHPFKLALLPKAIDRIKNRFTHARKAKRAALFCLMLWR